MLTNMQGVYRKGRVVLRNNPTNIPDDTPVIVTFLESGRLDLRARGITKQLARTLRAQLAAFAEEWESPEMSAYDDYDAAITRV
jgi:hypothetical protein